MEKGKKKPSDKKKPIGMAMKAKDRCFDGQAYVAEEGVITAPADEFVGLLHFPLSHDEAVGVVAAIFLCEATELVGETHHAKHCSRVGHHRNL